MPNLIRNYIAGGTYFFTLVTSKRTRFFEDKRCVDAFLSAMSTIQKYHHFDLIAYCILPDHIHLLITLAEVDYDFSSRIKEIKRKTTVAIREIMENPTLGVWQGRFWNIRSEIRMTSSTASITFITTRSNMGILTPLIGNGPVIGVIMGKTRISRR